jgi:hypothetical protein
MGGEGDGWKGWVWYANKNVKNMFAFWLLKKWKDLMNENNIITYCVELSYLSSAFWFNI